MKSKSKGKKPEYASLRDLAARVGVSHQALSKAVARGRLVSVIEVNGVPVVPDLDVAAGEWEAVTGATKDAGTLAEATLSLQRQKALAAALENRERLRELTPTAAIKDYWFRMIDDAKAALLRVPAEAELAKIVRGADDIEKLEDLIHEALSGLARKGGWVELVPEGEKGHDAKAAGSPRRHRAADVGAVGAASTR